MLSLQKSISMIVALVALAVTAHGAAPPQRMKPASEFEDIVVHIQEASTGSLMFGVGVNSDSGLTVSIILNERNFDIVDPLADLPRIALPAPKRQR